MLVLSRNSKQTIHIGDDITVTILTVRGDKVRVGIQAPQHVCIDRSETRERRLKDAATTDSDCD